jgi:hypothetical protein
LPASQELRKDKELVANNSSDFFWDDFICSDTRRLGRK